MKKSLNQEIYYFITCKFFNFHFYKCISSICFVLLFKKIQAVVSYHQIIYTSHELIHVLESYPRDSSTSSSNKMGGERKVKGCSVSEGKFIA